MKKQLSYIAATFLISGMLSAQKIDLDAMPKPGPTPTINITQPKTFTLKNGLTVMVVENHKLPRVNVNLSMDRPPIKEGDITGVSDIFADQLGSGTTTIPKDEFNKKIDFLGASLNFSGSGAFANTLSKYFPQVMGLMADAIINPKFSAEEIQKSKDRAIEDLKVSEKNASAIAQKVGNALSYGKNTARGEFETEATLNKIQPSDIQNYYSKNYAPDNAYMVVVGDVRYNEVKDMVEKLFSNWKKSGTVYPALEPANNVAATEINTVDVPNAVQSVINIGDLTHLKMNDPQYFAASLANYILGGGAESRLFMNLREKNGFTYGAYSRLNASKYDSQFTSGASVRNEVTGKAVTEFMNELKGITTIKPEELKNAKEKLKGSFILSLEKPETLARFAVNQKTQNLPANFYTDYLKSIDKVSVQEVATAAQKVILPGQSRILVVGKGADINDQLEKVGYPVKYFDKEANPIAKPSVQKVDANITLASVMDKYIAAIGGKSTLEKITSITSLSSATIQGMQMEMKSVEAKGGKRLIDVSMMGNSMQKIVFDGQNGSMEARGQKIAMTDDMKSEFLGNKEIFPELSMAQDPAYKLSGIEKFNNEDCYVVKGAKKTIYYSVKTGLKAGEVRVAKDQSVPTTFSDYKEVNGIKLPYKISQNMGGMEIDFIVKSYEFNKATDADFK